VAGRIEESFHMLHETMDVYREWRKLVVFRAVSGLKVYDARLVATSIVHGLKTLLTFNVADFRRYSDIEILHPRDLVKG
jgi:predicted nucleic acid-binding protein